MPATLELDVIAPRYAAWPEAQEACVNVLCEGPSILSVRPQSLLDGPVVAVNHALALSDRIGIDCWATVDHPEILWEWADGRLDPGVKLFSTWNNILFWEEILGTESFNERIRLVEPVYMDYLGTPGMKPPVLPTVAFVLAWLGRMSGVKHVRLFGCDMRGEGSPLSAEPWRETDDVGWKYRWSVERTLISIITKKYRASGKRLERWARK